MVKVFTHGLMVVHMKDLGKIITCMGKAHIHGVMVGNMRVNTIWIRSMAMAYISGLMVVGTKAIGKMENSMAKESI